MRGGGGVAVRVCSCTTVRVSGAAAELDTLNVKVTQEGLVRGHEADT